MGPDDMSRRVKVYTIIALGFSFVFMGKHIGVICLESNGMSLMVVTPKGSEREAKQKKTKMKSNRCSGIEPDVGVEPTTLRLRRYSLRVSRSTD